MSSSSSDSSSDASSHASSVGLVPKNMRNRVIWQFFLALVAIVVLLIAIAAPRFGKTYHEIDVEFAYIGPVKPGAAVRISGMVLGKVNDVTFIGAGASKLGALPSSQANQPPVLVRVSVAIEDEAMPILTENAQFRVATFGVLGEHYVDIQPIAGGKLLHAGSVLRGVDMPRTDLLLAQASGVMGTIYDVMQTHGSDIAASLKTLQHLVRELDQLLIQYPPTTMAKEAEPLVRDLRNLSADIQKIVRGISAIIGDGKDLKRTIHHADRLFASLNPQETKELVNTLQNLLTQAENTMKSAQTSQYASVEKVDHLANNLEKTLVSLDGVAQKAHIMLDKVDQGQGAAGQLFQDEEIYGDLKYLVRTLRNNPWQLLMPQPTAEQTSDAPKAKP